MTHFTQTTDIDELNAWISTRAMNYHLLYKGSKGWLQSMPDEVKHTLNYSKYIGGIGITDQIISKTKKNKYSMKVEMWVFEDQDKYNAVVVKIPNDMLEYATLMVYRALNIEHFKHIPEAENNKEKIEALVEKAIIQNMRGLRASEIVDGTVIQARAPGKVKVL